MCLSAGFTVGALGSMKETLLATLRHDTAAISAVHCLHLYLERLDPGREGPRITQACISQTPPCEALLLCRVAWNDPAFSIVSSMLPS